MTLIPLEAAETSAERVLAALDPEQRAVAEALRGPVCVLAGAGTGKTRAITHRIAYGVHCGIFTPQHVLALTFTARAAGELRTRLRALGVGGVQARTFHSAALRQLGYFWPRVVGGAPPKVQEYKAPLVAEAANRLRLSVDRTTVRDLSAEIEWAKVAMLTPATYVAAAERAGRGQPGGVEFVTLARLLEVYEDVKAERGVIDFEDVLLLTAGILADRPDVADAVRAQYRHFVVDEYQDVSALQQHLLEQWLGGREELCVVGDPSQTIYSFAGASPEHLLRFGVKYPGATQVRLIRDYRSTPEVVALANRLIAGRGRTATPVLQLVSQRPSGPVPTLRGYDDDLAEAEAVAASVRALVAAGTRASEIAVLFRTNAQSQPLENALSEVGVPYVLRGGERFFQRKEVRDAVLLLRGAARAGTPEPAWDAEGDAAPGMPEQVRAVLASAGWSAAPPATGGAVRERWESLQALAVLADEFAESTPGATLGDLVAELDERAAAQHAPTVEGVTLASLHAAKGLEWDAVFLVGMSEGLMPISLAEGWAALEEERRLLYVGITRARQDLHLSWARARTPGGRGTRQPSRFLDGLLESAGTPAPAPRKAAAPRSARGGGLARTCRVCSAPLGTAAERKTARCSDCPPTYDEAVFERLRAWRKAAADAASVPAFVVFTDATLVAVAERAPSDERGLVAIPGIGPSKLARYGAQVLRVLAGDDLDDVIAEAVAAASTDSRPADAVDPGGRRRPAPGARTRVPADTPVADEGDDEPAASGELAFDLP
ncbi:MAG: ATP-dependent DNA helicase UvrD2 [Kineosporiaceae bacterium]